MFDMDQSTFCVEHVLWLEQLSSPFLESETFADDPFPTCGKCREGIHANQKELEIERAKEERDRKHLQIFYIFLALGFVAIIVYALLFSAS